ncbi:MAG TPA: AraC family transcriptional regulator [Gammaproteobacteria bacterium]|jgi:AraC-like DNA-binding protein
MLQEFSGATVRRTIDRSGAEVPEHAHDWPLLSLFVIGAYSNHTELGERRIAGPSAVLYAAGAVHRNQAGADGFEQIEIEFDPAWLGSRLPIDAVSNWIGGRGGVEAHALATLCSHDVNEKTLRAALQHFLEAASAVSHVRHPGWLDGITQRLKDDPTRKVAELAREAQLHPSWLGTAYRQVAGEGIMDAAARFRVEHATRLLRESDAPFTDIAMDAGFCDQSHMIRTFRRVLRRLPTAVREDRKYFRQN